MTEQKDCDGDCLSCNTDIYISCKKRINPNTQPDPGRSSEPPSVKVVDGSDREWRLISMYELRKIEQAINEKCVGHNDGCPPGHLKEMHDSGNETIDKVRARKANIPAKFTKNCMCNKYTNCMDCQQHDNEILNKALDKIDKELSMRVTAANERARKMQGAGYAYSAAGDQHEGLCLASMRDFIRNECRPKGE